MDEQEKATLGISPGTIVRTILLAIAIVNQVLSFLGKPLIYINSDQLSELIALVFSIATAVAAWWKNNSFTQAARAGDVVMHSIKEGYTVDVSVKDGENDEPES